MTTLNASRYGVRQSTTTAAKYEGTWANGLQVNFYQIFIILILLLIIIIIIITWANGLQVHFPRTKVISNSQMFLSHVNHYDLSQDGYGSETYADGGTYQVTQQNHASKALENIGKH